MEAVPRLPMLNFGLRTSAEKVDFSTKLKQYIKIQYNEDPTLYASGITGIDTMRKESINPSKSILSLSILKRYYCQLHFMGNRFPMKKDEEAAITFSWNSLHSSTTIALNDISFEMASILYNIGALHTQLGAMDNRTTAEGMKMSCTHFQCAAWAFQHINEAFPLSKQFGLPPLLISFMCHLCLAQAQECILEKSMMDNRKSAITAKVGIQVVDYYKQSLNFLTEWPFSENIPADVTSLKIYKTWMKYLNFKIAYYECLSLLFQGQQSEDQQKMGERVAYYQAAFEKLEEARKLPFGIENSENVVEALTFVHDVIEAKRKAAKNENEFIYHESVPNVMHLPKIKGASLVKGIPFDVNDPEVCGPDLFSNIVPMQAHEAASLYSEEKAKLLRKFNGMIENKDEELETFLSMLDLDEIRSKIEGAKLPQELIDKCASLNANPDAISQLTDSMQKLMEIYQEVGSMLSEIQEMLKKEENRETEYQQMLGERPPSIAATDLTREAKKYQEAHAKASESNQTLQKAMVMHVPNLKLLSLPLKELIKQIPSVSENTEIEAVTKEMQHLMLKIEEMKKQRYMLANQLKDLARQDDITNLVVTHSKDKLEELFDREMKKYDRYVSLIEQNLTAQENILRALKETYARYGATRKTAGEAYRKRAQVISSLIVSFDAYEDLLSKSNKGLDFYKKLETNVSKLLQRVKGTCEVQEEEREQMMKTVKKSESFIPPSSGSATGTLKLKDYLNIKKETGKLSLVHPGTIPSTSSHLNDLNSHLHKNWIPDSRPAPVGSEETDTSYKNATDTFRGFYQSQGRDQVWNTFNYSAPQNIDHKLNYFTPQTIDQFPSTNSQNVPLHLNNHLKDTYPISSYSTVQPKAEGGAGYEPKSNYYDISGSPNRCYNPVQLYGENVTGSSTADENYPKSDLNYPQPTDNGNYSQNVAAPSPYFACTTGVPGNYVLPQQPYFGIVPQPETTPGTYAPPQSHENQPPQSHQPILSPAYGIQTFPSKHIPYEAPDSEQLMHTPNVHPPIQNPIPYSSYAAIPAPSTVNAYAVDPVSNLNSGIYADNCQGQILSSSIGNSINNFTQEKTLHNAQNIQNYQTLPNPYVSENQIGSRIGVSNPTYAFGPAINPSYISYQPNDVPESWSQPLAALPQHYLQSGNESLYTASQTLNPCAITNSDVYKSTEPQSQTSQNYDYQYYNNQYGSYNGQMNGNVESRYSSTYMQAGTDKQQAVTTTTFSISEAKSSSVSNPSNVDLLAGLDFNIDHCPLVPQAPIQKDKNGEEKSASKLETNTEKSIKLNLSETENFTEKKILPSEDLNFSNAENLYRFAQEVEKFEKFVEGLTVKTLNGPTNLDLKWKEILDVQEKVSCQHIISVARCYPMKNRFPDILPYDDSRIELPSTKDDYINASRMSGLTKLTPPFILTQAPLPSTYADFWAMVFEQQVEVIVCLLSDAETDGHIYWPVEKNRALEMGKLKISLQSSNVRSHWVERILSIFHTETRSTRVVVHLQFTAWPGSSFPESPDQFLLFSAECRNYFKQQRSYNHPVVVHCISGVGRSGLFCLVTASILDIQAGNGIPDLAAIAGRMCQFRKNCLRDREHLKFAFQTILQYCRNILKKKDVLAGSSSSISDNNKIRNEKGSKNCGSENIPGTASAGSESLAQEIEQIKLDSADLDKNKSNEDTSHNNLCSLSEVPSTNSKFASESANLIFKTNPSNQRIKKFTADASNKGSLSEANSSDDPLNRLDPFWSMKK